MGTALTKEIEARTDKEAPAEEGPQQSGKPKQQPEEWPKQHRKLRRIAQRSTQRERKKELKFFNHCNCIFKKTKCIIHSHETLLKQQYGFIADTSFPLWKNVQNTLLHMTSLHCFICPNNKKVNILLDKNQQKQLPPGSIQLLGLGLNLCLKKPKPTNKIKATIEHFKKYIRREYTFHHVPISNNFT